jgi:hypothetical protein
MMGITHEVKSVANVVIIRVVIPITHEYNTELFLRRTHFILYRLANCDISKYLIMSREYS